MSNILKRKNEESDTSDDDQLSKRVALDSVQLEIKEKHESDAQTAPQVLNPESSSATPEPKTREIADALNDVLSTHQDDSQGHTSKDPDISDYQSSAKPISSHREKEEANQVSVRMFCPVKEAGVVVGRKGDKITHIREKANVRVYISENLKNIPDRVVTVKGSVENVARAFGLIIRTILEEPEDEPASVLSKLYILKLLVPHPIVGYIIGKGGSKFREIQESSAAKLKAAEQPLPYSTDRVLTVTGVADAIHIAVYYIAQVILEQADTLKKHKVIHYNPANFRHQQVGPAPMMGIPPMGSQPNVIPYMHTGGMTLGLGPGPGPMKEPLPYHQKPYDYLLMFQPAVRPHYNGPLNMGAPPPMPPQQNLYTDEHGNTIVGDVITHMAVQDTSDPEKFTQDVFVANSNIGSVIGKGGHNIKQIRENSGCIYVKIEPDQNQSILLGGGKGLTNIRRLTLTGSYNSTQNAIFLINQRISADKEKNGVY